MPKEIKWYKVADNIIELDFQSNNMCVTEANGKKITIARYNDGLFGFAYKCPHASGIMSEGYINALGNVVCPLHRYTFSIQNGRNTSGEGYYLKTYLVEERQEGIYVGMEKAGIFG
jgi:3-phenylpropionate/trans-cinnamate dioxygenase ferredoxin subunit